ncbi:MAG: NAD(P)-dependent oxidoreductase [Saprospiraceae bacterium]|nr:NAD(P)-dependent oxidoreductase [Saprospiraceae bacterium]MDW8484841.1 NAD(P)-dependent oxidoreductase [Saprospiraceae bacterium]
MSCRLLVTGANGFIGSALTEHALALGWDVTAAVRRGSDCRYLADKRLHFVHLPYESPQELSKVLRQQGRFEYVAHIAGTTKALHRKDYFRVNADYTRHLAQALSDEAVRPSCFLFLSSIAALGPAQEAERVHPDQLPRPVTTYGASKLAAEIHLEAYKESLPWIVIQPTAVFGPRDRDLFQFIRMVHYGLELYIGLRPQPASFIYVKDLVELMLTALERGPKGQKLIATDGRDYTTDDLGAAVRTALSRRTLRVRLPVSVVRLIAALNEQYGRLNNKMPALNREKLRELIDVNWHCDASRTFQQLNFYPAYDLYRGMEETIQWYRHHEWL